MDFRIFFADIGQGSCNIIVFPLDDLDPKRAWFSSEEVVNQAILVDCGPKKSKVPIEILQEQNVRIIDAIILSHNDGDHANGVQNILDNYPPLSGGQKCITDFYYVPDRSDNENKIRSSANRAYSNGYILNIPETLQTDVQGSSQSKPCATIRDFKNSRLICLSPTGNEASGYRAEGKKSNEASAVVMLQSSSFSVLFTGDAMMQSMHGIHQRIGKRIACDILTVPHHGGIIGWNQELPLRDLYNKYVSAEHAIVSASTTNSHGHPCKEVLDCIYESDPGCRVVCTQATRNCSCRGVSRKSKRTLTNFPAESTNRSEPRSRPCVGTICVDCTKDGIRFVQLNNQIMKAKAWLKRQQLACPLQPN